jgi:ferric-dicitrate binding protein FerR (iron transport regulator)
MTQTPARTGREWATIVTRAVPHQQLGLLLRTSDPDLRTAVLTEFRQWLHSRGDQWATWQAAWNTWTGAAPGCAGLVDYQPASCQQCRGRRIDMRRAALCHVCMGTGTARRQRIPAGYAAAPAPDAA